MIASVSNSLILKDPSTATAAWMPTIITSVARPSNCRLNFLLDLPLTARFIHSFYFRYNWKLRHVMCGSLQCQMGTRYPIVAGMDQMYSRTLVSMAGREFECKWVLHSYAVQMTSDPFFSFSGFGSFYFNHHYSIRSRITSGTVAAADLPDLGIVRDGTPCGNNLVRLYTQSLQMTSIHNSISV